MDNNNIFKTGNIKLFHININGLYGRKAELINYLNDCKPHFVTLNETKLREQTIIRIPNYHLVRKDRTIPKNNDKNNNKNKENEIDTSDFEEGFLAINFKIQGKTIALATINSPPGNTPNKNNFKHILKSHPLAIFMGDYNCKHIFFGCKKANKEGDILFDILEELELLITNDDTPTHRPGTNIGDLLDLAIVSRQMAPRIE